MHVCECIFVFVYFCVVVQNGIPFILSSKVFAALIPSKNSKCRVLYNVIRCVKIRHVMRNSFVKCVCVLNKYFAPCTFYFRSISCLSLIWASLCVRVYADDIEERENLSPHFINSIAHTRWFLFSSNLFGCQPHATFYIIHRRSTSIRFCRLARFFFHNGQATTQSNVPKTDLPLDPID